MTIEELETKISTLNSADKAAAIEILLQTLSTGSLGIKKNSRRVWRRCLCW